MKADIPLLADLATKTPSSIAPSPKKPKICAANCKGIVIACIIPTNSSLVGFILSKAVYKCLNKVKLSNQPSSENKNDGLKLYNSYITTALKCVPPGDKPTFLELKTCFNYFKEEIDLLKNVKTIIALGKIAFDACIQFYKENYFLRNKDYIFGHGKKYQLPDKKILVGCYHPSPRNVNTGRIDEKKMTYLFKKVLKLT